MAESWSLLGTGFESLLIHKMKNSWFYMIIKQLLVNTWPVKTDVMKSACSQLFWGFIKSVPSSIFTGKNIVSHSFIHFTLNKWILLWGLQTIIHQFFQLLMFSFSLIFTYHVFSSCVNKGVLYASYPFF